MHSATVKLLSSCYMKVQKFLISYFRVKIRLLSLFSKQKAGNAAFEIFCTPYSRFFYKAIEVSNVQTLNYHFEGLAISGYRWGEKSSKKALIVHGFRSDARKFQHFALQLVAKGYEVYAFDAPAHGTSTGETLNAITYKNFVSHIDKDFGPFDAYITHSFGGLATSLHLAEVPSNHYIKTVLIAPAANSQILIEQFFDEMKIFDKKVQEYFYDNIKRLSGKNISWFSLARCAPHMHGPVLWIHDLSDRITPVSDAQLLQQKGYPNFRFIFTNNLGHRRIYHDENVIAEVMNFL